MRKCEAIPEHNIFLDRRIISLDRISYTTLLVSTLQSISSSGIEFLVLVLSHPDMMLREQSPVVLKTVWCGEELLSAGRVNLVTDRLAADRILLLKVLDFKGSSVKRVDIEARGGGDWRLPHFVPIPIRVPIRIDLHG